MHINLKTYKEIPTVNLHFHPLPKKKCDTKFSLNANKNFIKDLFLFIFLQILWNLYQAAQHAANFQKFYNTNTIKVTIIERSPGSRSLFFQSQQKLY